MARKFRNPAFAKNRVAPQDASTIFRVLRVLRVSVVNRALPGLRRRPSALRESIRAYTLAPDLAAWRGAPTGTGCTTTRSQRPASGGERIKGLLSDKRCRATQALWN